MPKTLPVLSAPVIAVLAMMAFNEHAQAAPVDLSSLTCEEARNRIKAAESKPTLVQTGERTYTDVYRARFHCPRGTRGAVQSIVTSDNPKCRIGYSCFADSVN